MVDDAVGHHDGKLAALKREPLGIDELKLDLLRESGIDAPERVRRILKQGGAAAVVAEISKIHSDGTKRL